MNIVIDHIFANISIRYLIDSDIIMTIDYLIFDCYSEKNY